MVFPVIALALLLAFLASLVGFFRRMETAKAAVASLDSHVFASTLGSVEYSVKGSGYPVLVVHGITGGVDQSNGLADNYLSTGYKVISVSRFGYLKSSLPSDASAATQAQAFSELLTYLGVPRAVVLADSAGAPSAFEFAARYREQCKAIVLLSGAVPAQTEYKLPPKPVMQTLFSSDYLYYLACRLAPNAMLKQAGTPMEWLKTMTGQEKENLLNTILLGALPVNKRTQGVLFDMYVSTPSVENCSFEQITAPALLVVAKDDTLINFEDTKRCAARIEAAEYTEIEKGGHLFLSSESQIRHVIDDFLARRCDVAPLT